MSAETTTKPLDNVLLGIGFASINAFMLAGMGLFAKLLGQYYGPIEVTFFRNAISLLAIAAWIVFAGKLFLLKTERPWAHVFRSAVGTFGIVIGMWAIQILSIAETTVLLFTSPLFTLILSMLFLKECVGPYRISAIVLGFIGVIVIANPFSGALALPVLGLVLGLLWGFTSGCVDAILRWIGATENAMATTFYFCLFGTIACGVHWPFADIQPGALSGNALFAIMGIGITGVIALLAKTQSYRLGEASVIAPVLYTMIIWAALFDYLVWDILPTWNVVAGALIIISANFIIMYRERQKGTLQWKKAPAPEKVPRPRP